jgi:phosphatidylethanolamine/phosphatidyl-N-methylethanolamine N-methyltransferase
MQLRLLTRVGRLSMTRRSGRSQMWGGVRPLITLTPKMQRPSLRLELALVLPNYRSDLDVSGIDFSGDMLAKAQAKVDLLGLDHVKSLRQMDARNLDFDDASFDVAAAMHIISVVPEPERVMAEMTRVCKPGGLIVITNHFARDTGILAWIERRTAPFANLLGWHSDFEINTVLKQPELAVIEQKPLPPMGMMTFLVLRKEQR